MNIILKAFGTLAVIAIAMVIVERWYNMFYLGRLYDSINIGFALIGWVTPIGTVAVACYLIYRIWSHKFTLN